MSDWTNYTLLQQACQQLLESLPDRMMEGVFPVAAPSADHRRLGRPAGPVSVPVRPNLRTKTAKRPDKTNCFQLLISRHFPETPGYTFLEVVSVDCASTK